MSGRTKRILYHVADAALFLGFGLGMLLLTVFVPSREAFPRGDAELWQYPLAIAVLVSGIPVLLHECGHLLFGALAGMKLARFGFRPFPWSGSTAGETAMYPKNGKHVKGKFVAFTLGGAVVNIVIGVALFLLWLFLPTRAVGCGVLSGFVFYEGVRALLPAELPAGKTDGAVLLGLIKKSPEEEISLRVLTAQGILYQGNFSDLPEDLLFRTPVVREDLPAYHALLLLRVQALLARGAKAEAARTLARLGEAQAEADEEEKEEYLRYLSYFEGSFEACPSPLLGIDELEKQLESGT